MRRNFHRRDRRPGQMSRMGEAGAYMLVHAFACVEGEGQSSLWDESMISQAVIIYDVGESELAYRSPGHPYPEGRWSDRPDVHNYYVIHDTPLIWSILTGIMKDQAGLDRVWILDGGGKAS